MESEQPARDWSFGCLRAGVIAMLAMIALPLGTCAWLSWDSLRGQLPSSVSYLSVVHSSQSVGLREGCFEAVYKLAPETVARLKREGVAMLNRSRIPKQNPRNRYRAWRPTPLPFVRVTRGAAAPRFEAQPDPETPPFSLYAEQAESGCEPQTASPPSVGKMLANPGGFYTITDNAEGLIVIDTQQGLAGVLYAG